MIRKFTKDVGRNSWTLSGYRTQRVGLLLSIELSPLLIKWRKCTCGEWKKCLILSWPTNGHLGARPQSVGLLVNANARWAFLQSCKGASTLPTTCQLTLSIDLLRYQSTCRVDMSRTIFFCQLTCQADRYFVGFQQRMSIYRLQCGRMSVDIDRVELDKHWKNLVAFYFDNDKFSM